MAVACGAELGGKAGEAGADVVCQEHTAALSEAEHLPGLLHQVYGLVHGLGREGVLGAVDGGEEAGVCVLAKFCGGGTGLQLPLAGWCAGGVGLRQRNAHLMVAVEPQSPAEPEHCRLGDIALPGQRGNGEILRFVRMLQQVVSDRVTGSGQLVLSLMQQFPKICTHGQAPSSGPQCPHYFLYLLLPLPLHREGGIFIKSIKEVWPLDKCAFRHNSEEKAVQSI